MKETNLEHIAKTTNNLVERTRKVLQSSVDSKVQELAKELPNNATSVDGKIKIVFAGQYSSGKSSILRALTRRIDIAVGDGVVTEKVTSYDWNGVEIIDTPGIHTQTRPDHDEVSYQAIADADLLVFVITNELMDARIVEHFRKLACDKKKAAEMMLVVNKMDREPTGNTESARKIKFEQLRSHLTPLSPDNLYVSFVAAKSYMKAEAESVERRREKYLRESGMDEFIDQINRFVVEKGLCGRYSTTLYRLDRVVEAGLAYSSSGDVDVDATEEVLLQQRNKIDEVKKSLLRDARAAVHSGVSSVSEIGGTIADAVDDSFEQKSLEGKLSVAAEKVSHIQNEISEKISSIVSGKMKDLEDGIDTVMKSTFAQKVFVRLEKRIEDISPENMKNMESAGEMAECLGKFLAKRAVNKNVKLGGRIMAQSGSDIHKIVLGVGHKFGHAFKPYEAIKWAKGIGNAGKALGALGQVLGVVVQIKADRDQAKREKSLRDVRVDLRVRFAKAAKEIEMEYDKQINAYVVKNIDPCINQISAQLKELRSMQTQKTECYEELIHLHDDILHAIDIIHHSVGGETNDR